MEVGDRVVLTERRSGYQPGAEGLVTQENGNDTINVDIDTDHQGNAVDPPDPLIAVSTSAFRKK